MGISTDAFLYYGIDIYDTESCDNWLKRPESVKEDAWDSDIFDSLIQFVGNNSLKVEVDIHSSSEVPVVFIHPNLIFCANRGNPIDLYPARLTVTAEEHESLIKALEALRAPLSVHRNIGWHLASYMG